MDQLTGALKWNSVDLKYIMVKNSDGLKDVVLLLDPIGHVRDIEHLEIVRKAQGLNLNLLVILPEIKAEVGSHVEPLSESFSFACSNLGLESPVLIGSGYAALAIIVSLVNRKVGSSGFIAISPEYSEGIFSLLYRIEEPVWYIYGRGGPVEEERVMFRYHDLTAGSRLVKISGNARDIFVERPSQFISLLADYLDHV
ncbi:MAG: hypothetical protein QW597_00775 [Thermoplasmataceae archaeon]